MSSVILILAGLLIGSGFGWFDMVWLAILLWIVASVSRGASAFGRWLLSAYFTVQIIVTFVLFARGFLPLPPAAPAGWLVAGATLFLLGLLWSPSLSRWIDSHREPAFPWGTRPGRAVSPTSG